MKKYLITDPAYYTTTTQSFKEALNRSLIKYNPDFVCFRDKTDGDKKELLKTFVLAVKERRLKSFVNGSLEFALWFKADGVHLQSSQQRLIKEVKERDLSAIVSCHSKEEALSAFEKGADFVTLSPVFETPGKGAPLGIKSFSKMIEGLDKSRIFALGGIDDEQKVKEIEKLGVFGFASIRYFTK